MTNHFDADLINAVDEDELADSAELSALTGIRFRAFNEGVKCLVG